MITSGQSSRSAVSIRTIADVGRAQKWSLKVEYQGHQERANQIVRARFIETYGKQSPQRKVPIQKWKH